MYTFYEFFAGGGMARLGLGGNWDCVFANDIDKKKAAAYRTNFHPASELTVRDVADVKTSDLPNEADLAWASFPCQDLSLAGAGAGLTGERSGSFWPFWNLMGLLKAEKRAPKLIVLENVYGALTSHNGKDFTSIAEALASDGYLFGALLIDAKHFVPQSRPRLFVIAVRDDLNIPQRIRSRTPCEMWHPGAVLNANWNLSDDVAKKWIWWNLPIPPQRDSAFIDLIEETPLGVKWHSTSETERLLGMMSPANLAKVADAKKFGARVVGSIYKRTRCHNGVKVQRAEVRFDNIAGCLRTPVGGSSRQEIIIVEGENILTRLLSPREAARLMGVPEEYHLPDNYNAAYHLAGDGVVVPIVRHLVKYILDPILNEIYVNSRVAA